MTHPDRVCCLKFETSTSRRPKAVTSRAHVNLSIAGFPCGVLCPLRPTLWSPHRCGSMTCAICGKPLEAHIAPNTLQCQPPPVHPDLIALNARPCPGCMRLAAMREGSNCVSCNDCRTVFCWLCGMDLSAGWVCDNKSSSEIKEHTLLHHSHFWSLEVVAAFINDRPMDQRIVYRPSCEGMMNGVEATDAAYELRNGKIFGTANPEVKRGT